MATKSATSANVIRALRYHGHDIAFARDTGRRNGDGLRISNWVISGVVEVRIHNFRRTLRMDETVTAVKRDLEAGGYSVRIGHGDADENQTVLYVRIAEES